MPHRPLLVLMLSSAAILSGCGIAQRQEAEKAFQLEMEGYVGRSADEILMARGVPTSTAELSNGGRVLEYSSNRSVTSGGGSYTVNKPVYIPDPSGPGRWVNVPTQSTNPVHTRQKQCKLIFVVLPENVVQSWKADGNDCF